MTPDIIEFVSDPQLLGFNLSEAQETLLRPSTAPVPVSELSSRSTAPARAARTRPLQHSER